MNKINPALLTQKSPSEELLTLIIQQNTKMLAMAEEGSTFLIPETSQWSSTQHLEHLLYTSKTGIVLLLHALESSTETTPLHELGHALLRKGSFPRRETTSPSFAIPKDISHKKLTSSLRRLLAQVKDITEKCTAINTCTHTSEHPVLGGFTPRNWLQFIALHQNHHLYIIEDIVFQKNT